MWLIGMGILLLLAGVMVAYEILTDWREPRSLGHDKSTSLDTGRSLAQTQALERRLLKSLPSDWVKEGEDRAQQVWDWGEQQESSPSSGYVYRYNSLDSTVAVLYNHEMILQLPVRKNL